MQPAAPCAPRGKVGRAEARRSAGKGGAGMRTRPGRPSFSPALPCVDYRELTTQGLIYPRSSRVWQLLALCSKDMEESGPAGEEEEFASIGQLQQLVANRNEALERLQRRRCQLTRAYLRLRRQHAPDKVQRCLRRNLNRAWRMTAEAMEVRR